MTLHVTVYQPGGQLHSRYHVRLAWWEQTARVTARIVTGYARRGMRATVEQA